MRRIKEDQRGVTAIVVSVILILVIGLIIFSFAEVSRTNQNETLVNQLGQQAYDAAESGVNIVYQNIEQSIIAKTPFASETTSCDKTDSGSAGSGYKNTINAGSNLSPDGVVSVTCILVDTTPSDIVYKTLAVGDSIVWKIDTGGKAFSKLQFTWNGDLTGPPQNCSAMAVGTFTSSDNYSCDLPILRSDIFQNFSGSFTPQSLNQNTLNFLFQPTTTSSGTPAAINNDFRSYTYANVAAPNYVNNPMIVGCKITIDSANNNQCSETISFVSPTTNLFYVRLTSMYLSANNISLKVLNASGGRVDQVNSEALIDVTARARNEARRIRVYVPISSDTTGTLGPLTLPNNALESPGDICKQLQVDLTHNTETQSC